MTNPFQFGRELGADELVDRGEEIAEVVATIGQGGKLFLVGPRVRMRFEDPFFAQWIRRFTARL